MGFESGGFGLFLCVCCRQISKRRSMTIKEMIVDHRFELSLQAVRAVPQTGGEHDCIIIPPTAFC